MNLSQLIAKPVFSPAGEELGFVKAYSVNPRRNALSCLVCVNGEEEEFCLPARTLRFFREKIVAGRARLNAPTGVFPVGKSVYDKNGAYLGAVSDALCEETRLYLLVKGGPTRLLLPAALLSIQDAVILRGKRTGSADDGKKTGKKDAAEVKQQQKLYGGDLLGKVLSKNVTDGCGNTIAAAGEKVTPALLNRAKKCNRLLEVSAGTRRP